jgi:steroid 5-alpha reductase family enzyme
MTSTWDIIAENFGFMLVFGDTMFIQFVFSIPSWLICRQPADTAPALLDNLSIAVCIATFAVGYFIFRVSNKQKHDFKADPACLIWGRPARTIGGKLLVSGFWGYARHINYLGDIIIGIAFGLPAWYGGCGPASFVYPAYLVVLLLHRDWRDDAKCAHRSCGQSTRIWFLIASFRECIDVFGSRFRFYSTNITRYLISSSDGSSNGFYKVFCLL